MKCSHYKPQQSHEIQEMFTQAFTDSEGASEGNVIGELVNNLIANTDAGDLYGFVATEGHEIIGCIFFSRMTFADTIESFILAPVATATQHQGKGVGLALIRYGLDALKADGVELAITYGDPRFYTKVGFAVVSPDDIPPPFKLLHPEGWMAQTLNGTDMRPVPGPSACVAALNQPRYW